MCVYVCVYVCVCVRMCMCVSMQQVKLKILKIYHLYTTQNFTCLKCCYISPSIKMLYKLKQNWKRILLCIAF